MGKNTRRKNRTEDAPKLEALADTPSWEWPENAASLLLGFLRNDQADASDRLLAADLAGDYVVVNDELVDALLAILCNQEEAEELRSRAAISFGSAIESAVTGDFDDPDDVPISEPAYERIQDALTLLYMDAGVPKIVRRKILEVSVRARQDWNEAAVRAAYASGDHEWIVTSVFCMGYVWGFEPEILESLNCADHEIRYEAVRAAGYWQLAAAWPLIAPLLTSGKTVKSLLLTAIDAAAGICPKDELEIFHDLMDSDDEEIADAAASAAAIAEESWDDMDDDEDK